MTTTSAVPTRAVGFRSERGPVLLALMLSTGLVALDSTIIATAVPSVVSDLGGFSQFPWLFSVYLLTQAVTVPLYGKFADVIGRRPIMFLGIGVFLAGSVLCGIAWSMPALIAFRAVQGIGAGAVQPMSMTMVGDMYTVEERARVQGYIASVWGIAAVIGPALGGMFSQYISWRWIFFVNLPIGAAAAWMLASRFKESVTKRSHRIDYAGAVLLICGCSLVILGLLEGGVAWGWGSAPSLSVFVVGAALLAAFLMVERRAAEPILPLWVFGRRVLTGGNLSLVVQQVMEVGTLAIGQTVVILTAGIDLSNGAVMALGTIVMTRLAVGAGVPPLLAILIGVAVCAAFGAANGLLVTMARLPAFIVTLGTLNIAFALTHIYSKEQTVTGLPRVLTALGETFPFGNTDVTYGSVVMLAMFLAGWYVLRYTAAGRHVYAVGDNPEAARFTGISTRRLLITVYTVAGAVYGVAGLLLVGRTAVGDPQAGATDNLDSITAVVLGGISLFGGRGSIIGVLFGALIVGVIRNGLQLMGVASIYQVLITGILVILAVGVDQVARRRRA